MASLSWILLLSAVPCITGIQFYITRSPGHENCALTECSYDATEHESDKFSIKQISIWDVTQTSNKYQLAYRKFGDKDTYFDPTKLNDINGTSKVTKFHADIRLNFRNPADCMYESYECYVVYVDDLGKKQIVRKTIAPDSPDVDNDCSCSAITYHLDKLTNRANGASRQLYGLSLNLDNIQVDLNSVTNGTTELSSDIARLQESHQNILVSVNELRESGREIDSLMNNLRSTDYTVESKINELLNLDEDKKQTIAALRQNDKNTDKQLSQLTRDDNSQMTSIELLQQADGVALTDINNLQQRDDNLEAKVNSLKNESSSLTNQIGQLRENDNSARADISVLSSHDGEIQGATAGLRKTDNEIDRQISQLNRNDVELLEDAAQAKQATADKVREINELGQKFSDIGADIARLEQNDQDIDAKLDGLDKKNAEIDNDLNDLLSEDVKIREAIDERKTVNAVHQESIGYLRRNNTAFQLQISDLLVTDRVIVTQITEVSSIGSSVQSSVQVAQVQQRDIREEMDRLENLMRVIESRIRTATITTTSETTSSLVLTSCTRGMPHDNARAAILLYGSVPTVCDTETDGGGWILFQRRTNGEDNFYRTWSDYKVGFGNPSGNFYIGNDNLAKLTDAGFTELRIDLTYKGKQYYAHYSQFRVEGEESKYRLHVSGYEGSAPDSFSYHDGSQFSTYDQDNDGSYDSCAKSKKGGWWYKDCYESNLNGVWGKDDDTGMIWKAFSDDKSVSVVEMKIRAPVNYA